MQLSGFVGLIIFWALGFGVLVSGTYFTVQLKLSVEKRRRDASPKPGVTVLKPLKGLDEGLTDNLDSFFRQSYPDFELIFSVSDQNDPAISVVRELMVKYPKQQAKLLIKENNIVFNPKVNNLIYGYETAKNDLILISDSNIRVIPDYLEQLVSQLDENTGVVTARVVGTQSQNFAGDLEATILNTYYARTYLLVARLLGHPVVMGKTMLFRKSVAERFGGLRFLGKYLAEDFMAGEEFLKLGLKIKMISCPTVQIIGRQKLHDFWYRHVRWGRIHKAHSPMAFILTPFLGMVVSGVLGVIGFWGVFGINPTLFFLAHCTFWQVLDFVTIWCVNNAVRLRDLGACLTREFLAFPMWLHTAAGNVVSWRGRNFRISQGGMMQEVKAGLAEIVQPGTRMRASS